MKKLILSCCILICSASLLSSCASKEKVKDQFVKECKGSLPGSVPAAAGDEYCSCSADKLMARYSLSEMISLNKKVLSGDEKAKAEMMKAIQPCLDELMKKAAAQQSQ